MNESALDSPLSVVSLLRRTSRQYATSPALEYAGTSVTYGTLDQLSDSLAGYLHRELGVRPGDCIGVCLEPSPRMVIAILAVLKIGAAYVPIDPDLPRGRIAYIAKDAELGLVVVQRKFAIDVAMACAQCGPPRLFRLDQDRDWLTYPSAPVQELPEPAPHDLAYILYTSGSTGEPKGVLIEHRGLLNLTRVWIQLFRISPRTRMLQFASLSFDAAAAEIFPALVGGAALVLSAREDIIPGRALAAFLGMIVGCIQLGVYPRFAEKFWLPVPVDFVAAAMAHIALSGQRGSFHLILDRDREAGHVDMFRIVSELGYPMEALTPQQWFGRLAACGPDNALYPIMPYLLERVYEGRNSILEVHHSTPATANATTRRALAGSPIPVPAFDRALLATYLKYFVSCGLLPPPRAMAQGDAQPADLPLSAAPMEVTTS